MDFCVRKNVTEIVYLFEKCPHFNIKMFGNFFAFCVYKRARCLSMMTVIVIFIHIQKPTQKANNNNPVYVRNNKSSLEQ